VCFALDVALGLLEAEGYERIFARHAACGAAVRAGVAALGFRLFADPAVASDTVTAVHLPDGVEWSVMNRELRSRGLVLAGGQGKLTGRIFRVGHLGDVSVDELLAALTTLEETAETLGLPVERGRAVAAASEAARNADAAAATAA
jgi:aspartate aminotransferase-like enzyme